MTCIVIKALSLLSFVSYEFLMENVACCLMTADFVVNNPTMLKPMITAV